MLHGREGGGGKSRGSWPPHTDRSLLAPAARASYMIAAGGPKNIPLPHLPFTSFRRRSPACLSTHRPLGVCLCSCSSRSSPPLLPLPHCIICVLVCRRLSLLNLLYCTRLSYTQCVSWLFLFDIHLRRELYSDRGKTLHIIDRSNRRTPYTNSISIALFPSCRNP
jgi:hypothetical protein